MNNDIVQYCLFAIIAAILFVPLLMILFFRGRLTTNPPAAQTGNSNSRIATIFTAAFIIFMTLVSLVAFYCTHEIVGSKVKPVTVAWVKSDTLKIKPGPIWFYYDRRKGSLNSLHAINDNDKNQLANLINDNDRIFQSYSLALDQLAFQSNQAETPDIYGWLTLLYAVAGLLGVQLRTINNFIGIACHRNDFDFHRWWPWYLVRPLAGFITGGVVFLLIDGKQLLAGQPSGGMSALVLAAAFLGGFSADEFYELLRTISKRIFA
jgi:hypothetical protein